MAATLAAPSARGGAWPRPTRPGRDNRPAPDDFRDTVRGLSRTPSRRRTRRWKPRRPARVPRRRRVRLLRRRGQQEGRQRGRWRRTGGRRTSGGRRGCLGRRSPSGLPSWVATPGVCASCRKPSPGEHADEALRAMRGHIRGHAARGGGGVEARGSQEAERALPSREGSGIMRGMNKLQREARRASRLSRFDAPARGRRRVLRRRAGACRTPRSVTPLRRSPAWNTSAGTVRGAPRGSSRQASWSSTSGPPGARPASCRSPSTRADRRRLPRRRRDARRERRHGGDQRKGDPRVRDRGPREVP